MGRGLWGGGEESEADPIPGAELDARLDPTTLLSPPEPKLRVRGSIINRLSHPGARLCLLVLYIVRFAIRLTVSVLSLFSPFALYTVTDMVVCEP